MLVYAYNFPINWEENFLFIEENDVAKCLVYYKMLNEISKYNLQRHNTLFHAKDFDKHKDNERTCVVENLKSNSTINMTAVELVLL